jgi:N-acetylmuramic acid 6-phosphate etherase
MPESQSSLPPDRSHISTERRNPRTMNLHTLSVEECVERINTEDRHAFDAVKRARGRLSTLIEAIEPSFLAGGRLIYVGAGTSGRLGVLDASEAPPTFQVPPDRIIGIIAGGDGALRKSSEGLEDHEQGAWQELASLSLTKNDSVIAIAAGGTTPYAVGALAYCKTQLTNSPVTALLCCATIDMPPHCDHLVMLRTGPEALTGSTRMKAGTATKLALNLISTTLMVRSGRVYQNLMVDLKATNSKLRDRAARIITELTGLARDESFSLLDRAGGEVKTAAVMHKRGVDAARARTLLRDCDGRLGKVFGDVPAAAVEEAEEIEDGDESPW